MEAGDAESAGAGGGSGMEHALTHELAPGDPTPTSDWSEEQTVVWIERTLELSPEAVAQLRDECRREEFDGHSLVYCKTKSLRNMLERAGLPEVDEAAARLIRARDQLAAGLDVSPLPSQPRGSASHSPGGGASGGEEAVPPPQWRTVLKVDDPGLTTAAPRCS
jgi:hypothetical protein